MSRFDKIVKEIGTMKEQIETFGYVETWFEDSPGKEKRWYIRYDGAFYRTKVYGVEIKEQSVDRFEGALRRKAADISDGAGRPVAYDVVWLSRVKTPKPNESRQEQFGVEYIVKDIDTGQELLRTRSPSAAKNEKERYRRQGKRVNVVIASKESIDEQPARDAEAGMFLDELCGNLTRMNAEDYVPEGSFTVFYDGALGRWDWKVTGR